MDKIQSATERGPAPGFPRGQALLRDSTLNKGTAFTARERDLLGLRGLLPPHIHTLQEQVVRVMENYQRKTTDLERYIYLLALQDRNETLFYRVLLEHLEAMMPIIYTPTVGTACLEYGRILRHPRGLYVCAEDAGRIPQVLGNWPYPDPRVIVVTDGERILGLGDLGAFGTGIPVGKLTLYTACAGIAPGQCLPVMLDVGTENAALLQDRLYTGIRRRRLRGPEYDALVAEFIAAAQARFPRALVQFEDFGNRNAMRLLAQYRGRLCTFNDDIQGTGAVALAGICSALKLTGGRLQDQRLLLLGMGQAGIGIASALVHALQEEGMSAAEARRRCWCMDSKGLVVQGRKDLSEDKTLFAHEHPGCADLLVAIQSLKPTILIGVSGNPGAFGQAVIEAMTQLNERPIIFALSNPTSKSECTAEAVCRWSGGRAIFASGSPFPPITIENKAFLTSQVNNVYVFPGVGLCALACELRGVTDRMFYVAAKTLAAQVSAADLSQGRILPTVDRIRQVSLAIATTVAEVAFADGLAGIARPDDLPAFLQARMYEPVYRDYV